jgi:phosphonate transport system substrate-binding protein
MRRALLQILCLLLGPFLAGFPATAADWRKELGIFRVGLIEAAAPSQAGRDALKQAFSAALGMPVEILVLRDWPQLIDAQASARVDYAVYSSTAYATASELCSCVEPLAAPVDVDRAAGVRAVVLVRSGKAASLSQVSSIRVAAPGPDDLTGWMAPLALLPEAGLSLKGDEAFLLRADSATQAIERFRDGEADAIFGWERASVASDEPLAGGTAAEAPEVKTQVIWRSPLIRFGPHAVQKSLYGEAKKALVSFLAGLHGSNPQAYDLLSQGHGGGFVASTDAEYGIVREIVRKAAARSP